MKYIVKRTQAGFTLVELLTTLAVIAVLLGLMIPALSQVQKTAANVKQKGQFNAIGVALEAFRSDIGDYPPSAYNVLGSSKYATASHHLAEAVIGCDGFGFHPCSQFRADGKGDIDGDGTPDPITPGATLYDVVSGVAASRGAAYNQTGAQNLAARKGPYLELEHANAVKLQDIYPAGLTQLNKDAYVLADMYKHLKNFRTGKQTGMPILYYRANKLKIGNDPDPPQWINNTYNVDDSICMTLGIPSYPVGAHPLADPGNASIFYNAIQNPNFTSPARPYRSESYLLHSAGPDGLYGTGDDVFNFDQEK